MPLRPPLLPLLLFSASSAVSAAVAAVSAAVAAVSAAVAAVSAAAVSLSDCVVAVDDGAAAAAAAPAAVTAAIALPDPVMPAFQCPLSRIYDNQTRSQEELFFACALQYGSI